MDFEYPEAEMQYLFSKFDNLVDVFEDDVIKAYNKSLFKRI